MVKEMNKVMADKMINQMMD